MNDNSKKRHELQKQLASKVQVISDLAHVEKVLSYLTTPKKFSIVDSATNIPSKGSVETKKLIICFDFFNWNTCNFDQFNPAKGRKLLQILEQVATCEVGRFPELKLGRDSVGRGGEFDSLFSRVTPEVTKIEETEFCDGRIFYIITEPYFHMISVETKHRNVDR